MSVLQKCVFWTFSFHYSERRHVLEVNQPKMSMSIDQLWKNKCFLPLRLHLKSPHRWAHQAGSLQKQFNQLQSPLAEGDELSASPSTYFRQVFFVIASNVCSDVAWLISIKQWSWKKMTTWICPFLIAHASVEQSAATPRMNGWMLFPLTQHQSCRSLKYCRLFLWLFLIKCSLLFCFSTVLMTLKSGCS